MEKLVKHNYRVPFAIAHPELLKEWAFEKNIDVSPFVITAGSSKKVWWKCSVCGFEWETKIYTRHEGKGCPRCAIEHKVSFPEKAIFFYLQKYYQVVENQKFLEINNMELDIFIPKIKIAVEYDGGRWHQNVERDLKKDLLCKNAGIAIIHIRDPYCPELTNTSSKSIHLSNYSDKELEKAIKLLCSYIGIKSVDVDIDRDRIEIYKLLQLRKKNNSLAIKNPVLAKEWNYKRNTGLSPESISWKSRKKVWWKCSICGYEWQAALNGRSRGDGCPACAGLVLLSGFNDLQTKFPDIAKEWHPTKNFPLKPNNVIFNSFEKVWWKCSVCGFEWQAVINNRVYRHFNCKRCSALLTGKANSIPKNEKHSLLSNNLLLQEWNYERNEKVDFKDIAVNSNKKVWWKCSVCGYEWQAFISNRNRGAGCPVCKNRRVISGVNDLVTTDPEMAKDWDYSKNDILPNSITNNSSKKVWWKCHTCGYEWQASPNSRKGCKKCSYITRALKLMKPQKGESLEEVFPEVAKKWDFSKNVNYGPSQVKPKSGKKVWWRCNKCGYEWEERIQQMTERGNCPNCKS